MRHQIGQVYEPNIQLSEHELDLPRGYDSQIGLACFSGDGRRVLTVHEVGTALIWETDSRVLVGEITPTSPLTGREGGSPAIGSTFEVFIEAVALNRNGDIALLGLNDDTAGLFSVADGTRLFTFTEPDHDVAHASTIRAVAFSPDEKLAAVGFFHRGVGIWDTQTGELVRFLMHPQHNRYSSAFNGAFYTLITALTFSADGTHLFARCRDDVGFIWNYVTGELDYNALNSNDQILALTGHGCDIHWATAAGYVLEARAGEKPRCILDSGESWTKASFAADGQSVLAQTNQGVSRWTLSGQCSNPARVAEPPSALKGGIPASGPALLYYSNYIVNAGYDDKLLLFQDGELIGELQTAGKSRYSFAVTWERNWAAVQEEIADNKPSDPTQLVSDINVAIYALPSGECIRRIPIADSFAVTPYFSPNGAFLALVITKRVYEEYAPGQKVMRQNKNLIMVETEQWRQWLVFENIKEAQRLEAIVFGPQNTWFATFIEHACCCINMTGHPNWPYDKPAYIDCHGYSLKHHLLSDGRLLVLMSKGDDCFIEMWRPPMPDETPEQYGETYLLYTIPLNEKRHPNACWSITDSEQGLLYTPGERTVYHYNIADGSLVARYDVGMPDMQQIPDSSIGLEERELYLCGERWLGPGGPYLVQRGEMARSFGFMQFRPSGDGKYVVLAGRPANTFVVMIDEIPNQVVARIPLQGNYRASRILDNQVVIVDSLGKIYLTAIKNNRE